MYIESVAEYSSRPDVREAIRLSRALNEARAKQHILEMQQELGMLSHKVGNGQVKRALEYAEPDMKLFLPAGYEVK